MNGRRFNQHNDVLTAKPDTDAARDRLVDELKRRGNCAFKAKKMNEAKVLYSKALEHNPKITSLRGNRSAVNLAMGEYAAALHDANAAIEIDGSWVKGYYRKGQALNKLGRHLESMAAFQKAAELKPDDKRMLKLVAEQLKKSKQPKKKLKQSNCTNSKPQKAPKKIGATATAAAKAKPGVKSDGAKDLGLRGYKTKKDGSKTSYFNTEWSEQTKDLYKDVGPKKMDAKVEVVTAKTGEASAWNSAGTYEECDVSTWAKGRLTELLGSFELPLMANGSSDAAGNLRTVKLKDLSCDATRPVIRNKRRYLYEASFQLEWEASLPPSVRGAAGAGKLLGTMTYPEVTSDSDRPFECVVKFKSALPSDEARRLLLDRLRSPKDGLNGMVQAKLDTFVNEHRQSKMQ